jgi:hypothetical protein
MIRFGFANTESTGQEATMTNNDHLEVTPAAAQRSLDRIFEMRASALSVHGSPSFAGGRYTTGVAEAASALWAEATAELHAHVTAGRALGINSTTQYDTVEAANTGELTT